MSYCEKNTTVAKATKSNARINRIRIYVKLCDEHNTDDRNLGSFCV